MLNAAPVIWLQVPLAAMAALAIAGCENRPAATIRDAAAVTIAATIANPPPANPPPANSDAGTEVGHTTATTADAPGVETAHYELFFDGIKKCDPTADSSTAGRVWMGAAIRARAKVNEFFVTAQDFTLEKGGIAVTARHVNPPGLPNCLPLLQPASLRAKQTARGFVLFEVPARLRTKDAPLTLAYRPRRWGGARRVEFVIPPCLDACDAPVADEKSGKTFRGRSHGSRKER